MRFSDIIKDLVVVSIPIQGHEDTMNKWRGSRNFFVPETCARHLYVGLEKDLQDIPEELLSLSRQRYQDKAVIKGREAYEFLLKVSCGLDSGKPGEHHVTNQIRTKWKEFQEEAPSVASAMKSLMDKLFEDTSLVRTHALHGDVKPISPYLSAKNLAAVSDDDEIVIFAGDTAPTISLARALGKHAINSAKTLYITHPDPAVAGTIAEQLTEERARHRIKSGVSLMDFSDALDTGRAAQHWFICSKAGDLAVDKKIVDAWNARAQSGGHIVHLNGDPDQRVSDDHFSTFGKRIPSGTLILPSAIQARCTQSKIDYNQLLQGAHNACVNCAMSRFSDTRPNKDYLTLPPNEYTEGLGKLEQKRFSKRTREGNKSLDEKR